MAKYSLKIVMLYICAVSEGMVPSDAPWLPNSVSGLYINKLASDSAGWL